MRKSGIPERVLVTGGTGYIGSHCVVALLEAGRDVVIADNLSNSRAEVVDRIERLAGKRPAFERIDLRDAAAVDELFSRYPIDTVVHFAGLKAVGESVAQPLRYYDNNVAGTLRLLEAMQARGVRKMVFSSSCTVYGAPDAVPVAEGAPLRPQSPYGHTKLAVENILRDLAAAESGWRIALLRYFNPIGAHPSALIGEQPGGIPDNLMPYLTQVVAGRLPELRVFGGDYATPDGTGVRDYIHVTDLVQGHLAALDWLERPGDAVLTANLGTGQGYSVLDVVRAFERATGKAVAYRIVARRPGDVAVCYADPGLARSVLNWRAERSLDEMCRDAWNWQRSSSAA
jgi:UDP-glucose 4-epimerase